VAGSDALVERVAPLLERVASAAARDFRQAGPALWEGVERMLAAESPTAAGGSGAFGSARDDHRFLASVLDLRLAGLLVANLPWIYRSARGRGLAADLPERRFRHWARAAASALPAASSGPVAAVLDWILEHHGDWVRLAASEPSPAGPGDPRWESVYPDFLDALVEGRQWDGLRLAEAQVRSAADLGAFHDQLLAPALREVGRRWELGRLSVAVEHRAGEMARRICDVLSHTLVPFLHCKGRVVVTAVPGERHDLGMRILSDLLAGDGWAVDCLGADLPAGDLLDLVRQVRPQVVALSMTMPFDLGAVRDLVGRLRAGAGPRRPKVIVGGALFARDRDLWRRLGADARADSAGEGAAVLAGWWQGPVRPAKGP
jgi:methanogenic corrinoid protein MtbC1